MAKFVVQMVNKYTGSVEEERVDDMVFSVESDADEYASYMNSCSSEGAEILKMSNPFDYEEDYGDDENYEYVVTELDED